METKNHKTESTLSIPREKFLSIISQLQGENYRSNALNPQPIPPESVFITDLAFQAIDRLITIQETADLMNKSNGNKYQMIIGEQMADLIKNLCGTEPYSLHIKIRRNPYGDPIPRPNWNEKLSGIELVKIGVMFEKMANQLIGHELHQNLKKAGATMIDTGVSRM